MPDHSSAPASASPISRRSRNRAGDGENLWATLGFRRTDWGPGTSTLEWEATTAYGFHTPGGPVIQGGLVTAVLDSAMAGAAGRRSTTTRSF